MARLPCDEQLQPISSQRGYFFNAASLTPATTVVSLNHQHEAMIPLRQQNKFEKLHRAVLGNVSLKAFVVKKQGATYAASNVINWDVEGPETGFDLYLNNKIVSKKGEIYDQLLDAKTYTLTAKSGPYSKLLTSCTPNHDPTSWSPAELYLKTNIIPLSVRAVNSNPELSFRKKISKSSILSDLQFSGDRIYLKLPVKLKMRFLPDASAVIQLSFNISERNNQTLFENLKISIKIGYAIFYKFLLSKKTRKEKMRCVHVCFHQLLKRIDRFLNEHRSIKCSEKMESVRASDVMKHLPTAANILNIDMNKDLIPVNSKRRMDNILASAG